MDDDELRALLRAATQQIAAQADQIRELASLVRDQVTTQKVVSPLTLPDITVAGVWDKYKAARRSEVKPRSWMATESRMKPVLKYFGERPAMTVAPADEIGYRNLRLATKTPRGNLLTRLSYSNEIGCFVGMFNWAVEAEVLPENPLRKLKVKKVKNPRKTLYTEDDAEIVLDASNEWMRAMILVCKEAGMRPIEILTLERNQLDRGTGFAHLRADQTKNGKARSVKLSTRTWEAIDDLPQGIRWVFTNPKTGGHWSQRTLNRWWRDMAKETGLQGAPGEMARFYDWRGTYATNMNRAGVSLPVIKETLGHSDYRQLEMYLRIGQQDLAAGADRLEEFDRAQRRRGPKRAPDRATVDSDHSTKRKGE